MVFSRIRIGHIPTLRTAPIPPGAGSPCRSQDDWTTTGFAQSAQRPPSVSSLNNVAADALLVRLTSNENVLPAMRPPSHDIQLRLRAAVTLPDIQVKSKVDGDEQLA
jgi:hypothetical protein